MTSSWYIPICLTSYCGIISRMSWDQTLLSNAALQHRRMSMWCLRCRLHVSILGCCSYKHILPHKTNEKWVSGLEETVRTTVVNRGLRGAYLIKTVEVMERSSFEWVFLFVICSVQMHLNIHVCLEVWKRLWHTTETWTWNWRRWFFTPIKATNTSTLYL